MPFIHIKSLPLQNDPDIPESIRKLSVDIAEFMAIDLEHITVTWEYIKPNHYAAGGRTAEYQSPTSHPLLVEVFLPDFNAQEKITRLFARIANRISEYTSINNENIFINARFARSELVYDQGSVVSW